VELLRFPRANAGALDGPTSFGTAAGLVALYEARKAGIEVPQRMVDLAIHRVEETRLPNGFYTYGSDYKYVPRLPANKEWGAVGRTQPCNYSLCSGNRPRSTSRHPRGAGGVLYESPRSWTWAVSTRCPIRSGFRRRGIITTTTITTPRGCWRRWPASDRPRTRSDRGARPAAPGAGGWVVVDFPMWDFTSRTGRRFGDDSAEV